MRMDINEMKYLLSNCGVTIFGRWRKKEMMRRFGVSKMSERGVRKVLKLFGHV